MSAQTYSLEPLVLTVFEVFSIVLVIISVYKFTRTEREENCVLSVIRYTRFP